MREKLFILLFFGIANLYGAPSEEITTDFLLKKAEERYQEGQKGGSIYGRKSGFNDALALYRQVETRYSRSDNLGELYINIGHCYYRLGRYGFALYYYERARGLLPRRSEIEGYAATARNRTGLTASPEKPSLRNLFFLKGFISIPESFRFFSGFAIITIMLLLMTIRFSNVVLKRVCFGFGLCAAYFFAVAGYHTYFLPIKGILVYAAEVSRSPDLSGPKVSNNPLVSGTSLDILDVTDEGRRIKVLTPDGLPGYVSYEAVRLL